MHAGGVSVLHAAHVLDAAGHLSSSVQHTPTTRYQKTIKNIR